MDSVLVLLAQYPIVASVLVVVGALRLVLKPLLAIARSVVQYTENKADDLVLDKVEGNKIVKGVLWVLDYLFSLKLIK